MRLGSERVSHESLENYLYLESTGQMCFIKPTNYDNVYRINRIAVYSRGNSRAISKNGFF